MVAHPRSLVALPTVAMVTALGAGVAFAQCPTTAMSCQICAPGCGVVESTSTQQATGSLFCPSSGSSMSFNLTTGSFSATGAGGSNYSGIANLVARDSYTLGGLPAETPLTILARLHVTGNTGGGCGLDAPPSGSITASLTVGASSQSASAASVFTGCDPQFFFCCSNAVAMNTDVVLSIPCIAGQPFQLETRLNANARSNQATVSGTLTFDALPAGTSVTSCQGYTQSGPVPVNATSWGRIKQIYR